MIALPLCSENHFVDGEIRRPRDVLLGALTLGMSRRERSK